MEVDVTHGPIKEVTMEEVEKVVTSMKPGKASDVLEVVAGEHTIASGMVGVELITGIANHMLDGEAVPDDWRQCVGALV